MLQFFALFKTKHASSAVPGRIRKHHLATYRKPILLPNTPGRNTRDSSVLQEPLEPEHDATEPWCCRATFEHQNHSISQAGSTLAMVGKSPISHHGLPCRTTLRNGAPCSSVHADPQLQHVFIFHLDF